jgi:ferric-dicitrate binding protein FerR (iron transport regulator)
MSDQATGGDPIERLVRGAGPRLGVPADRTLRVREAAQASWRSTVSERRRARWLAWGAVPLAAAAVWAVVIASGVWKGTGTAPPSPPIATLERSEGSVVWPDHPYRAAGSTLDAGTSLETGADGRVALRLRGGASVRFDVGSRARLVSETEVLLHRGTVYVDTGSARVPGTTVVIRTALGTVRDVGTQFQVRVSGDAVRLSVREGIASLEHRGLSHDAPSGTRLTVDAEGNVTNLSVPSSGPEWDWIQEAAPPFVLEGRLLGEYLDWVGRETGLQIDYADPSIPRDASAVILHGSVQGLRPGETLEAVLPTCGLRHRVDGGTLIIERAAGSVRHE